ncbi:MAG: hypothetical protein ABIR36_02735 [Nitrospiraceae bacterium]
MTRQSQRLSIIGMVGLFIALFGWSHPVTYAAETDSAISALETEAVGAVRSEVRPRVRAMAVEEQSGEVESRGLPQGNPGQPGAPGQPNAQLPAYPQKFDVQGPERDSFGFAVTQPGQVVVEVQSQGAPVIVTLQGPALQPISQQGSGQVRLTYNVTAQEVQKSVLWGLQIRLAQPAPPAQGGRASGMVNVQHPPVNQATVQQAVQAMAAQQKQPSAQEQQQAAAQAANQMAATFQQHKAQFDRQQMDRRAAMMSQIQPQLDQLRSRMGGQIRPRGLDEPEETSGAGSPPAEGDVATRGLRGEQMIGAMQQPLDAGTMRQPGAIIPPATTSSSSQALQSAGTTAGPQTVMPNPAIASINVTQGQPGDPVMISGSGFGTGGEVHFVIAPGKDLIAPAGAIWSDNQIFATVPEAAGVLAFNGTVYIKRAAGTVNSNLVPFRFIPLMELRQITRLADVVLQQFNGVNAGVSAYNNYMDSVGRQHGYLFWGPKGNDQIYLNTRLKNGWIVSQTPTVFVSHAYYANQGDAYLIESHVGTDRPHVKVGFWMGSGIYVTYNYSISMLIQGPKGVPDGVVVP